MFKWVWEKEKAKLWSILAGHCEHRVRDECVVVASGDAIVEQKRQSKRTLVRRPLKAPLACHAVDKAPFFTSGASIVHKDNRIEEC